MKKIVLKCVGSIAVLCLLAFVAFFALLKYYEIKIPYGTWVNGIYLTGFGYDEAAQLLLEQSTYVPELQVVDIEGNSHNLTLPEEAYTLSYRIGLEEKISTGELFGSKHLEIEPFVLIDEDVFQSYLQQHKLCQPKTFPKGKSRLEIVKMDDGFHLIDHLEHILDVEKASDAILEAFKNHAKVLILAETDCYYTPSYATDDTKIKDEYIKLLNFCNTFSMELTIEGKVAYTVDASVLKDWLLTKKDGSYALDKNGNYQLDKAKVKEYATQISKETSTYFGKPWSFMNHNGETVEVKAGNYGRALNTNELYKVLLNGFSQGNQAKLVYELEFIFYPITAKDIGYGAEIGTSYIEVDISNQKVYLYLDGECVLESDCVTGDASKRYDTPKGVFYVEYKQRNRVLKGEDYRTPVSYWMHFYNHCGFHDASWRKSFGESIYLKNGSHGCINMPPEKAKEMYELAYKGMPVIVY